MTTGTDGEARTGQSMASRLQHQIFYLAIHVGGRRLAYGLLFFVVLWYTALPKIRARSRPYLSRRFSGAGPLAMLWHAFRLNLAFGCTLVDRAVAGITGDFSVTASKEDEDTALGLAAEGKGVVLLTAHVGNWQSVLSKLTFFPARKTIVMHRADADTDRQYYEHGDGGPPFGIIDPASPLAVRWKCWMHFAAEACSAAWATGFSAVPETHWRLRFSTMPSGSRSASIA